MTRAVHRIVDPGIPPERAQDVVLHVVEAQPLPGDGGALVAPRTRKGHDALVDVLDGAHRIPLNHRLDRERVVEVDPVRHLLVPGVEARIHRLQVREIALEESAVSRVLLESAVVEQVDARRIAGAEVTVQNGLPLAVIDRVGVRVVVLRPGHSGFRRPSRCSRLRSSQPMVRRTVKPRNTGPRRVFRFISSRFMSDVPPSSGPAGGH